MDRLTRLSLRNATVVFIAMLLVLAGGWYSVSQMKSEALPDIDAPYIWMTIVYPGATPHDVSKEVTEPLEKAVQGVDGVKNLTTKAFQNYGVVILEFGHSVDLDKAWQDLNSIVQGVPLPAQVKKPELHKANVNNPDIIRFAISGPGTQEELAQFVSDTVKPKLAAISGVETVDISGVAEKKVFIKLDPDKLKEHQATPDMVKQALQFANFSIPAGQVTMDDKLLPIEVTKEMTGLDEIKNIRLVTLDTSKIFRDALSGVGDGFSQISRAMTQLSTGMQQGLSGLSKMQALTQTQIRLLTAIQSLTGLIAEEQAQLQSLLAQRAPVQQVEGLQQKITAEKGQLQGLMTQLTNINDQIAAQNGPPPSSTAGQPAGLPSPGSSDGKLESSPEVKVIKLEDIAEIDYGYEKKSFLSRTNGKPGVTFSLTRQSGANVVEVSDQAKDVINTLKLPANYQIETLFDLAVPIKVSVESMVKESLLGAIFAILIIFVFLRNFRATIVAVTAIPLSIFASFIILNWLNYTINIMTLSGMAVAVGRVVDDSIVVIENIFRRLTGERGGTNLVREATGEVASAITSSTITTIAVFGPLAMVSGVVGKVFTPFAVTVVIALSFSLLVALTVVPLMGRSLLRNTPLREKEDSPIQRWYGRLLAWSLSHKTVVILIALATLAGSAFMGARIGTNFLPQDKVRIYQIEIGMPAGASLNRTDEVARKVETVLASEPGVKTYQTSVADNGSAYIFMVFRDDVVDTKTLSEEIRARLKTVEGAQDIGLQELGGPGGNPMMQIIVVGNDSASIKKGAELITAAMRQVPGLANINSSLEEVKPQVRIKIDEEMAARRGLSPIMVAGLIRSMISGENLGKVNLDGKFADMVLTVSGNDMSSVEKITKLTLLSMTGEKVPVGDIAEVTLKPGPTSIQSRNLQEFAEVQALITDSNSGKVDQEVKTKLKGVSLPDDVTYSFEGTTQMMADGFRDMGIAMAVAILLVFIVMVGAFGNTRSPLAILFSLPMAVIGGLLGLFITGEELGMPALIGGLMLIGIVVTNAIVLVDRVQRQAELGLSVDDALIEAGKTRLRPIIMTAVTTIFALLPLAVAPAEGALISRSLAVVVIGGLTTSTALTLIVVPVVYKVLDNISNLFLKNNSPGAIGPD